MGESSYLGGQCHASRNQQALAGNACGHHAELLLLYKAHEVLDLVLELGVLEVLLGVGVGGLVARVGVGERHVDGLIGRESSVLVRM